MKKYSNKLLRGVRRSKRGKRSKRAKRIKRTKRTKRTKRSKLSRIIKGGSLGKPCSDDGLMNENTGLVCIDGRLKCANFYEFLNSTRTCEKVVNE
jgi:hypothetical protein